MTPGKHLAEALNSNFSELIEEQYSELPPEARLMINREMFTAYAESKRGEILEGMRELAVHATPMLEKVIHDGFEKHVGVLSLTESPENLLMWAHYANSHEGFVVGFDSVHPFFDQRKSEKDELRHLKKVEYAESRPRHVLTDVENMAEFLIKSTDWEYDENGECWLHWLMQMYKLRPSPMMCVFSECRSMPLSPFVSARELVQKQERLSDHYYARILN